MINVTGNLDLIKKINRSLVLDKIKTDQPISRVQIAKMLNLSKSTVSTIVDELLERKLVIELGEKSYSKGGGRPALMLGFNPKSAYCIGVDIDRSNILIVITDLNGNIFFKKRVDSTNQIDELITIIKSCLIEAHISEEKIIAMGVGIPGNTNNEIVFRAKALNWTNLNFQKLVKPHFPFPVFINNDVNCAGYGEMWLGSGGHSNNLFFVEIGKSIGSAIISNGNIMYGYDYQAGEICYQISRTDIENRRFNLHGNPGVFETKVSGNALAKHGFTYKEIFRKYSLGVEEVVPIIESFVTELSIVIANAVNLLNPEIVVIGGEVSESMDVVINEIQELVKCLTPIDTRIKLASLGGDSGALGAICFALKQIELS